MMEDFEDEDEADDYPAFGPDERKEKLFMVVEVFTHNIGNIENMVNELYDLVESDEDVGDAISSLIDLAGELGYALEGVDSAITGLIGYDEPKPKDSDVDFEESVLRDLANLDKMSESLLFEARKQHFKSELNRRGFGL